MHAEYAHHLSVARDRNRTRVERDIALADVLLAPDPTTPAALDVGITLHERAATARSTVSLIRLGIAYRERGSRQKRPDDLRRAVEVTRLALTDPAMPPRPRADALSMLALALTSRFELTGEQGDVTEALTVAREAAHTDIEPGRHLRLNNLGFVLIMFLHHVGGRSLRTELVEVAQAAVATAADQHERGFAAGLLAAALSERAAATGDIGDRTAAITASRHAVDALTGHPEQANHLANLAKYHFDRYGDVHSLDDLDQAVTSAQAARAGMDADDPRRGDLLSTLTGALEHRFTLRGDIDDLLAAVAAAEETVQGSPPSSARHAAMLSNLATVRRALAEQTADPGDANEAIRVAQRAAAIDGDRNPIRLLTLASCYGTRFRVTGDATDLDRAARPLRQALTIVPAEHPFRATLLSELGQRLIERYAHTPDTPSLLTEAIDLFRRAAGLTTAPSTDRIRAAGRWGAAAGRHGRLADAARGNATAVRLLPLAAWHGLDRHSQETQLRTWNPVVTTAAAQAIDLDHPGDAVEQLEHGRNVLWSHDLGRRADLTGLHAVNPDLAGRLDTVRRTLN